jgi:hypothetical protein
MANTFTIAVIGVNDVITAPKGKPYTVVVNGKGIPGSNAKINQAKLTVNGKAPTNIIVRKQPFKWVVSFQIDKVVIGTDYKVHIADDQGNSAEHTFQFQAPALAPVKGLNNRFDPQTGSTVDGSGFYVTFPDPMGLALYVGIQQPGGPWYGGMMVVPPPPNAVFFFQGIPAGDGYTITVVEWNNPPQYYYSNDIKVT